MSNHVVCGQIIPPHKPCHKFDQWLVSFICKLSALIWNTAFYRDGIAVSVIGCIRDLITWNALNDFPTDSNNKMAAGMRLPCLCQTFKITAVLFRCRSRICRIMDNYPIYLRKLCSRSGILIDRSAALPQNPEIPQHTWQALIPLPPLLLIFLPLYAPALQ